MKENNAYTLDESKGIPVEQKYGLNKRDFKIKTIPDGNPTETRRQNRIEENRIEENRIEENRIEEINKCTLGEFKNVKLKKEEFDKLIEKLGEDNTKKLIEELSGYMASKKTKYINHYATLLNWSRRKEENKKGKGIEL